MITGKIHEKALKGLTSALSDYDCNDGEMQVCHNMLHDGAGLRPVKAMDAMAGVKAGHELLYVHHTANGDVYITCKNDTLYWTKDGKVTSLERAWQEGFQITSVGNILCMSNGEEIGYFLWKGDAEGYAYLGDKLPELKMEFALKLSRKDIKEHVGILMKANDFSSISTIATADESKQVEYGSIDLDDNGSISPSSSSDDWFSILADNRARDALIADLTTSFEAIMGTVNKMIADAKEENCFTHTFLLRYAYELYDGTICMQSVPILMVPSTTINPVIFCKEVNDNWSGGGVETSGGLPRKITYAVQLVCGKLWMRVKNFSDLSEWKDIITRVNIYVSQQVMPYNPDGRKMLIENSYRIRDCYSIGYTEAFDPENTHKIDTSDLISLSATKYDSDTSNKVGYIYLPTLTDTSYKKKIEDTYNFYLLKQYTFDELQAKDVSKWYDVDFTTGTLKSIETREQMTDDYHSHDIITASVLNAYNNRLNKANCQLIPFTDMPGEWLSCFTTDRLWVTGVYTYSADIYLKDNGVKIKVSTTSVNRMLMSGYFYYPNPSAYLMVISRSDGKYCSVALEKHSFLYGAFKYIEDFLTADDSKYWQSDITGDTTVSGETAFSYPNYLYTSEVDNPFVFPSTGVNAMGNGRIIALKTATKAMSQGTSFGTNPLYAFCTDGIWALEVGDTGVFSAKQPVSRETLLNDNALAVTQIDNSILFISERGLMELVGGETRYLSGVLQELHSTFDVDTLPSWTAIHKKFGGQQYLEADDFMSYIDGARIAFDYIDYRVVAFRPCKTDTTGSAYVYDMVSKCWGTVENRFLSVVEDNATTLVNYMQDGIVHAGEFTRDGTTLFGEGMGFYTTRPMKFGAPDTLKTIRTLIERSLTQQPHYMALWGSRDMERWVLIGAVVGGRMPRLSGTPYKYFIVGGWVQLPINGGAISRLTADVVEKWTDKLR